MRMRYVNLHFAYLITLLLTWSMLMWKVSQLLACSHYDSPWRRNSSHVERMGAECSTSGTCQSRRFDGDDFTAL